MNCCRFLIFTVLIFAGAVSSAVSSLPKNLTSNDQIRALEILGFGSAAKVLDNPYPLGGYSGFEFGVSTEFIPLEDLSRLGSQSNDDGEFNFYTLSFGKGLYHNLDVHVYFTPLVERDELNSFGGQLRWGFYETSFFPLSLTALIYGGGANFSNLINIRTMGADIIATVTMDRVGLYAGIGGVRAIGTFIGGPNGITADTQTTTRDILEEHSVFGVSIGMSKMFIAMQVDRYSDSTYSGKLGFRF